MRPVLLPRGALARRRDAEQQRWSEAQTRTGLSDTAAGDLRGRRELAAWVDAALTVLFARGRSELVGSPGAACRDTLAGSGPASPVRLVLWDEPGRAGCA